MVLGLCVVIANSKKPQRDQRKTFRHADNADYIDQKNSLRDQREISLMDSTLCDGFDFPVNEKNIPQWAVTNADSLENWKSKTGHAQNIHSIASGRVISAVDGTVTIEHHFAENGRIREIHSRYTGLTTFEVAKNEWIVRGKKIGSSTNNTFTLKIKNLNGKNENPSPFIRTHRKVTIPFRENKLVLIDKGKFKCYLYCKGKLLRTYEIALGQVPVGAKEKQGDLKVPEGEYRICEKSKGPFSTAHNWSAAYLGTRWMCLTYPNNFDAQRALDKKMITQEQFNKIDQATNAGIKPPQNTALGGGIGLHGWIEEDWSNDSDRAQTWGCVSFHNHDLNEIYELVDMKTKVIIIP